MPASREGTVWFLSAARAGHLVAKEDVLSSGVCTEEEFDFWLAVNPFVSVPGAREPALEPENYELKNGDLVELYSAAELVRRVRALGAFSRRVLGVKGSGGDVQ